MSQQSFHQQPANGSNIAFTITTFSEDEIKVYVDGVESTNGGSSQNDYTIPNYTTTGGTVTWNTSGSLTAPASPSVVRVVRQTDVLNNGNTAVEGRATYQAGASVKADDLNNNQKQVLRALQEHNDQKIQTYDLEDGAVNSAKIKDASIVEGDLANSAVTSNKIADNAVTTTEILNGAVTRAKLEADIIDGTKLADNAVDSEHYTDGSIERVHLEADIIDSTKLADNAVNSEHYVNGSIDREHLSADIIDSTKLADNAVGAEHIQAGAITGTEIATGTLDSRYYTKAQSDAAYFNVSTGDTIKDGDTFPDNDTTIATTAAINDRIIDLVDDVGGFVPIANETSFPTSNPDVNDGAGTIVSVSAASTNLVPSGTTVTIANGRGSGLAVIITGVSATIPSGFGFLVETTTTDHTYTFHRLSPKATEVTTVASKATEIGRLGTADAVADMAILGTADVVADLNTLGTADVVSDMNTLGTADVVADMNTLAVTSVVNNMDTVAGAVTNVNNVGSSITNVNNVAGALTNIANVAGALTNVNHVGGSITNVNNVGNSISNVNSVASNLGTVNDFAARYRSGANNPTTSLDTGDLFFNTTSSSLKVYTGSAWVDGVTTTGNFALKTGNTFTGSNRYNDSAKAEFGTSADLEIFHSGSNSFIKQVGTGDLFLQCDNGETIYLRPKANEDGVKIINDGAVELYYDNSKKFETASGGVGVTGNITVSGTVDGVDIAAFKTSFDNLSTDIVNDTTPQLGGDLQSNGNDIDFADDDKAIFGTGSDLSIRHSSSGNSLIDNTTGTFYIRADDLQLASYAATEPYLKGISNGGVELYHNNVKQFQTESNGIQVFGHIYTDDNDQIRMGAGSDLKIYHDGSNSYIDDTGTGNLNLNGSAIQILKAGGTENMARFISDGAVELYHDNSKKFETDSGGVNVTGNVNADGIRLDDNQTVRMGTGGDLQIFHDGTNSRINNTTGKLMLKDDVIEFVRQADDSVSFVVNEGGSTELYHNHNKRLETHANGVVIPSGSNNCLRIFGTNNAHATSGFVISQNDGTNSQLRAYGSDASTNGKIHLNSSRSDGSNAKEIIFDSGNLEFPDNQKAIFGTGDDLEIYSSGSMAHIKAANDDLRIETSRLTVLNRAGNETLIDTYQDGAVELYHNNSKKFETTSLGTTIIGDLFFDNPDYAGSDLHWDSSLKHLKFEDGVAAKFGAGTDLSIYHDGSTNHIKSGNAGTNDLKITNTGNFIVDTNESEFLIRGIKNAQAELYYDNSKKFETTSSGAKVTGSLVVSDGSQLQLQNGFNNRSAEILNNGATGNSAIQFKTNGTSRLTIRSDGHWEPAANNTYDLGTSTYRWRNIYTNDLNLSNEGGKNDVDGTWGDWTIQEGESDLFLKNNRSGKKYKFNLTEVS